MAGTWHGDDRCPYPDRFEGTGQQLALDHRHSLVGVAVDEQERRSSVYIREWREYYASFLGESA